MSDHRDLANRKAEQKRLAQNLAGYEGQWVAVKGDQVVLADDSFTRLLDTVNESGVDIDTTFKVGRADVTYILSCNCSTQDTNEPEKLAL